ncbi:MAG TPA: DUF177 domain-containing protein [Chloroflexota bacterium]|nr:DUF177 domain-containing protein [Chloroflexota bacterium]
MLAHNVAALLKAPPGTNRDIEIFDEHPRFGPEFVTTAAVRGRARLFRTQDAIVVRGHIDTVIEVECSRCLDPFPFPISMDFEEEFRPSINITTGAPLELAEDEALRIDEHHVLDLTELVRQYLLTNAPLQPVCSPDCRGLCPTCGADLNEQACACPSDVDSSPFSALAPLLDRKTTGRS